MSQLLDAIRRASRASRVEHEVRAAVRPAPDVLLRTLGGSARHARSLSVRLVGLFAIGLMLAAAMWIAFVGPPGPPTPGAPTRPTVPASDAPQPPPPGDRLPDADPRSTTMAGERGGHAAAPPLAGRADAVPSTTRAASRGRSWSAPASLDSQPGGAVLHTYAEFERAVRLQRAGDFDAAQRIYAELLRQDALAPEVHNNLGLLLQARGDLDDAQAHFERAIAGRPGYVAAHNNLGVLLLTAGHVAGAEASFRRAAELDARDPDPMVNLALAQKALGRAERARESLLYALSLSPRSAPAHYNLAVLSEQAGERGRAVEHYRAFLEYAGPEHGRHVALVQSRLQTLQRAAQGRAQFPDE